MPEPKLHHYVPQFYLRRFTDSTGRLWVWDRDRDRTFQARPNSIAAETHFYYLDDLAERGGDPLALERYLSSVEHDGASITLNWIDQTRKKRPLERVEFSQEERNDAAIYLATQYLRTADARSILSHWTSINDNDRVLSAPEQRQLQARVLLGDDILAWLAQKLYASIWIFARNSTSTPFLTSDSPILFRSGDNSMWLKSALDLQGTYMVYPLAPDVMMYSHPKELHFVNFEKMDCMISPVIYIEDMADSENTGQAFSASRFVFSHVNKFDSIRVFAKTIGTNEYADYWNERDEI